MSDDGVAVLTNEDCDRQISEVMDRLQPLWLTERLRDLVWLRYGVTL